MAFVDRLDFLSSENQCGQTLLRIVSRGSSIIAELLRLSTNIPEVFYGPDKVKDPEQRKYLDVLIDFTYLRNPDEFEKKLNDQQELSDLDHEFQDNHKDILDRFYKIFDSIFKYQLDINKYINDINNGYYLQHSLDNILQDIGGRQLLSEVLYLWGIILITLEEKIPGYIRERMLIALYRLNGEVGLENFDSVCKLCRNSGFIPGPEGKRPKNHPDAFMARFPMNPELIRLVIGRLQTDDIYLMANSYPSPDHRSTRLANQAAMLYIILYFAPDLLNNNKATMREIVDKYFNDNWVIATYMGQVVDLTVEWAPYPAAKTAIDNIITTTLVKSLHDKNIELMSKSLKELQDYLKEGLLTQEYMLDNIDNLMNCVRHCNIALRWRILHRKTSLRQNETFRKIIESTVSPQAIVTLLLNASQLEYILKNMLQELLNQKDIAWTDGKTAAADRMVELSEYFTGEKALTRVKRDENLMKWFSSLAEEVKSLNLVDSHATATGRKIKTIMKALEDVEQFEAVDTNIQIKTFLNDAREIFRTMIRTVNIRNEILNSLDVISDLSYAWQILTDYITIFQERITKDPKSVVLLRAVFLKAASMLDVPLVRIMAIDSPDAVSVAAYYSQELVEFVRTVLGIIPVSVFHILGQIVSLQTNKMQPIPIRLEAKDLKDYAQLDARFELAKLTHEVSIFTEGILVMEKTLLGVIQVDPRQILEEGLRRELVRKLSYALHNDLTFKDFTNRKEIYDSMNNVANKLDGFKKSIEYLQDYISIAGLKIFQQEFSRTINYNTEQEANRFIKKKIFDSLSRYQNKKIPIPRLIHQTSGTIDTEDTSALTFMGRIMSSMLALTDPTHTIYAPECSAWFEHPAPDQKAGPTIETCGIRTFALLERSIGVIGLRGLDRLLAFRTVNIFNQFLRYYSQQVHPFRTLLDQVRMSLFPEYKVPAGASKVYTTAVKKVENLMLPLLKFIRKIGQGQLIRRQIANLLQFGCQLDAHLLYQALDTFNRGLVNDIRIHYSNPEKPYPDSNNPLLFETTVLLEASGLDDPLQKIYVTSQPLEGLPVLLFLFLLAYLPKLEYDPNFGALIRKKSKMPLDGIPLAIGIACLLKQFHPSYTKQLLAYLGQFIRSNLQEIFHDVDNRPQDIPRDLLNTIIFMEQLCNFSSIPRAMVHAFVPPYIFDALKYSAVPIKK